MTNGSPNGEPFRIFRRAGGIAPADQVPMIAM